MTNISALNPKMAVNFKAATYNGVKIQVNDPKNNIMEDFKGAPEDNGVYNAVSIEVNRPSVEAGKKQHCHHGFYDYDCADCIVTSDIAPIYPVKKLPVVPVAYQATNYISNKTLINSDNLLNEDLVKKQDTDSLPEAEIIITEELIAIPAPNLTDVEAEKKTNDEVKDVEVSFKAKSDIEIVPPVEINPDVDISVVVENLSNKDFDIQAKQMEDIAKVSMESPENAVPYIVTEVFSELINITKMDTSDLVPPSEEQVELRKQIIINEIVKEQARVKGEDVEALELPYKITEKDLKEASRLSSMEQAERNKEYALYTMAILTKVYTDEVEKISGNVVPLTDLPGVSSIVDSLKNDSNPGVKIAAVDALRYLNRPEYKDELISILNLVVRDENPYVASNATFALESLN